MMTQEQFLLNSVYEIAMEWAKKLWVLKILLSIITTKYQSEHFLIYFDFSKNILWKNILILSCEETWLARGFAIEIQSLKRKYYTK